mgnify:CR=1 FL=1
MAQFSKDKELQEYRRIMTPPDEQGFEDGFNWKSVAGALFMGFFVNPATDYLNLVIGNDANIGNAMKWVLVIFFAEVAKRSFTSLKTQELYVLHFMAGAALADPFTGFLWKQYVARSEYVQGLGLAAELPTWAFPRAAELAETGRTFFTMAWLPPIFLTLFHILVGRIDNYGLGYVLYRMVNDVEELPFPFAPVNAAGIVALSTDRGGETTWRWRCFAIGGMIGMVWGAIYICVPMITEAILPKRIELIPLVFIDLTPQFGRVLNAVPFNLVLNFGAFMSGMIVPFWGVMGALFGLIFTFVANPILQNAGILANWEPDMGFVDTTFVNHVDFYLSFTIGLTLAVTFSQFSMMLLTGVRNLLMPNTRELKNEKSFIQGFRDGWRTLITNNTARGDFSIFIAIGIYLVSVSSWIFLGLYLIGPHYPWVIMCFYVLVYNPLISYASAKLEATCGRAVNIPYVKELTIILSGYEGVDIWFAPMPIMNVGREVVGFRVLELTGTKIKSQVKTLALTMPIVLIASLLSSELLWRMADVPSSAYPFTEKMWDLKLKQWCLMRTATMEGGSLFMESLHFDYALWGLLSGSGLFAVLAALGMPVMLVFGMVWGLAQTSPGTIFLQVLGALTARFYFKRKYKDMWLKYMTVIMAGFGCGLGLMSMVSMAFNVITRMLNPTPW